MDHHETAAWLGSVAELSRDFPGLLEERLELFVAPGFLEIASATRILTPAGIRIAAQDVAAQERGALTGEVSAVNLAQVGVSFAEIGHAERRGLFGEDNALVNAKVKAALRNRLTPVLCVGEPEHSPVDEAIDFCVCQVASALAEADEGRVIVAYEPGWAIGAAEPAAPEHISAVAAALRTHLDAEDRQYSQIIYGGSAGPGLLRQLEGSVDGLFLGRFAHNPDNLRAVLEEVESIGRRHA